MEIAAIPHPLPHPLRGLSSFICTVTNPQERQLHLPFLSVQQHFEKIPSRVLVVTPDDKSREVALKELDGLVYLCEGWNELMVEYSLKEDEMVLFSYRKGSPLFLSFVNGKQMAETAFGMHEVSGGRGAIFKLTDGAAELKTPTAGSFIPNVGSPKSPTIVMRTEPNNIRSVNSKPRKGWCSSSRADQVAPRLINFEEHDEQPHSTKHTTLPGPMVSLKYSRLPFPWRQKNVEDTSSFSAADGELNGLTKGTKLSNGVASCDVATCDEGRSAKKRRPAEEEMNQLLEEHESEEHVADGLDITYGKAPFVNTIFKVGTALPVYDLPANNCWITVPKEVGYTFDSLSISPMFALQNLTAGDNKMVFTFDGVKTWKVVCSVDWDWAALTSGWKEFAHDNRLEGGESFVLSRYPAIRYGWMVNRILCGADP